MTDDVITCVFRPCEECGKAVLVLWHEDRSLIKAPQSCQEHRT